MDTPSPFDGQGHFVGLDPVFVTERLTQAQRDSYSAVERAVRENAESVENTRLAKQAVTVAQKKLERAEAALANIPRPTRIDLCRTDLATG